MQSLLESLLNYIMRHYHETFVELRPNHEAPPWAPTKRGHGITSWPDHEAPPRNHHGITSWPWGTTMRSHLEIHGITS